jgi:hypothetical protein
MSSPVSGVVQLRCTRQKRQPWSKLSVKAASWWFSQSMIRNAFAIPG